MQTDKKAPCEDLVSVIMPTYNRAGFLRRSIQSCFEQTHQAVEVLVVDDGSDDNSGEVIAAMQKEYGEERLRYFYQQNQGPSAARNTGLRYARGRYIQFLDSDDYLHPEKFGRQIGAMKKKGVPAAICGFRYVDAVTGKFIRDDLNNDGDVRNRLSVFRGIHPATTLMDKASIPLSLLFDPSIYFYEDRDFFFRYFLGIRDYSYDPACMVFYAQHKEQLTSNPPSKVDYEKFFRCAFQYWNEIKETAPPENFRMVHRLLRTLSVKAYLKGQSGQAVRLSFRSFLLQREKREIFFAGTVLVKAVILLLAGVFGIRRTPRLAAPASLGS